MLKVELTGDWKKLQRDLEKFAKRAMPYAMRDAVNTAAFEARRVWGDEIRRTFTTRNTFTAGPALRVEKARSGTGRAIEARLGSIAEYMPRQEFGATVSGRRGHKGIPGPTAAGQAAGSVRTKPVRRGFRQGGIIAIKTTGGATRHQRNAIALARAKKAGSRFVVLERPRGGKGVFLLSGGKRRITTRLLWDVSRRSVRLSPKPTLEPTLKRIGERMDAIMTAAVLKQLRFHRIAGY